MRTIIPENEDTEWPVDVYDTDKTPLLELMKRDILWAYIWKDCYVFKTNSEDPYDAQVYLVNKNTKKVEWGYYTGLGILAEENGQSVSPEELKRALT